MKRLIVTFLFTVVGSGIFMSGMLMWDALLKGEKLFSELKRKLYIPLSTMFMGFLFFIGHVIGYIKNIETYKVQYNKSISKTRNVKVQPQRGETRVELPDGSELIILCTSKMGEKIAEYAEKGYYFQKNHNTDTIIVSNNQDTVYFMLGDPDDF